LAWLYIIRLAATMPGMQMPQGDMPGMDMPGMGAMVAPALKPWTPTDAAFMFTMWFVMMIGMMLPSVAPMLLIYARVGRQAVSRGHPFAATWWFAAGYLLAWAGFAATATLAQWALERAALLTPMMAAASHVFGGIVLIAAGLYQWTPLKDACLAQCQAPLAFIQRYGGFRGKPLAALEMGLRHGAYCVGCCWALMALLFVGGIMNVLWIAALTVLVLLEKVLPAGWLIARIAGAVFLVLGIWLVFTGMR
jgi:predicted metal-binding membrane protein